MGSLLWRVINYILKPRFEECWLLHADQHQAWSGLDLEHCIYSTGLTQDQRQLWSWFITSIFAQDAVLYPTCDAQSTLAW